MELWDVQLAVCLMKCGLLNRGIMNRVTYALVSGRLSTAGGKYLCATGFGAVGRSTRGIGRPGSVK